MFEEHSDDRTDHGELEAYADLCSLVRNYPRDMVKGDYPDWSNRDIGLEITICTSETLLEIQNLGLSSRSIGYLMTKTYDGDISIYTSLNHRGRKEIVRIDLRDRVIRKDEKSIPYDALSDEDKAAIDRCRACVIMEPRVFEAYDDVYKTAVASFEMKTAKLGSYEESRESHLYIHSGEWFPLIYAESLMKELVSIAKRYERSYSTVFLSVKRFLLAFHLDSGKITIYPSRSDRVMPDPEGSMKDIPDNLDGYCRALDLEGVPLRDCGAFDLIRMPLDWVVPLD